MNITENDRKYIWHPFTQEKTSGDPIAISRGVGAYLYDEMGNKYLDLISSWWVNLHGHVNPLIAKAIYEQALKLEHIIFAGFTHEPAVMLCKKLSQVLPKSLSKFFFSDNGSTAVEVALKISYQFWCNKSNLERKTFLSFSGGYHGDTFGAMSVGWESNFHTHFRKLFFNCLSIPFPATFEGDLSVDDKEQHALMVLKQHLENHGKNIAAFILEPLIQGASGMNICRASFLQNVIDLVKEYGILIIFDEVMTGFGRTGTMFALEQVERVPDIICLSKGLTGGFLPLSLTVVTEEIYNNFLSDDHSSAFMHGHSYTANPLGCAAAIASLDLLRQPDTQSRIAKITEIHRKYLKKFSNIAQVKYVRQIGTIAAFDIISDKTNMQKLKKEFLKRGLLLRPLGDSVYILPPYCILERDLENTYDIILDIIN